MKSRTAEVGALASEGTNFGSRGDRAGRFAAWAAILLTLAGVAADAAEPVRNRAGERIYRKQCAHCHGPKGEGVHGKYDDALYGSRSVESLAKLIQRTMPEDTETKCSASEAQAVAAFIHDAFYSPEARARLHPAKVEPAHLTNRQFRESVADLIGSFTQVRQATKPGGLQAEYHQSKGMNKKDKLVLNRVDPEIRFDFGAGSPADGITPDQFSIAWSGSLLAPESGVYEFRLATPNGARVYLNADLLEGDANRRDDSSARRQSALIDLWVSSGGEMRTNSARVHLLGGRSYPLRVDYFKFKEKTASVVFEWRPPHGTWTVPGAEHLSPERSTGVAVLGTPFPADDGSQGYVRGTAVSRDWHEAVAKAAVETANLVAGRLGSLAGAGEGATNRVEKLKAFSAAFAERAFRRPLTPEVRERYVDRQFAGKPAPAPEVAIKRVVVAVLTSPRFLYPEAASAAAGEADSYRVAARLALALWDSLPDAPLLEAAAQGDLIHADRVRAQAERMLGDRRARAKLRGFFHHWLKVEEGSDISKDPKAYPDFDGAIMADLRVSLDRFLDEVVWSEASDYRELLLADHLYLNDRLARFYGVTLTEAGGTGGFRKVAVDPGQRAGVVTHPYLLATFAYHRSTSPIHRGVFLTRNVLGRALKPPPMAIEFMDDRFDPSLTMREKVTQLTSKDACMGCHATINPLGFALEHFDAVGRYRTEDNRKPVVAEAEYTTGEGEVLTLRGPRDVALHAAGDASARAGFVRQLFQHMVQQPPGAYGPDMLKRLDAGFAARGHNIRRLLVDIAVSTAAGGVVPDADVSKVSAVGRDPSSTVSASAP